MYSIVSFDEEGVVAGVPSNWIYYENGQRWCRWPNGPACMRLIERRAKPEEKWDRFPCRELLKGCTYDQIEINVENAQYSSEVNSPDVKTNACKRPCRETTPNQMPCSDDEPTQGQHAENYSPGSTFPPSPLPCSQQKGDSDSFKNLNRRCEQVPILATEEFCPALSCCASSSVVPEATRIEKQINDLAGLVKTMHTTVLKLREQVIENNLLVKDVKADFPIRVTSLRFFTPAASLEELNGILQRSDLIPCLVAAKRANLNRTVKEMLKIMLSRDLANDFTMSGLGAQRQRTKMKFDNSAACTAIEKSITQIPEYRNECRRDVKAAIRKALAAHVSNSKNLPKANIESHVPETELESITLKLEPVHQQ